MPCCISVWIHKPSGPKKNKNYILDIVIKVICYLIGEYVSPLFREERWGRNLLTEAGSDHYLSLWGLGGGGRSLDFGCDKIKFAWSPQRSCCGSPLYSLLATTERTGLPSENQVISPKSPDPPPSPKQHWLAHKLHPLKLHFFFHSMFTGMVKLWRKLLSCLWGKWRQDRVEWGCWKVLQP